MALRLVAIAKMTRKLENFKSTIPNLQVISAGPSSREADAKSQAEVIIPQVERISLSSGKLKSSFFFRIEQRFTGSKPCAMHTHCRMYSHTVDIEPASADRKAPTVGFCKDLLSSGCEMGRSCGGDRQPHIRHARKTNLRFVMHRDAETSYYGASCRPFRF